MPTSPDYGWFTPASEQLMRADDSYLVAGEGLRERVRAIVGEAARRLGPAAPAGFAGRFEEGVARGWCSFSTPVWCNFGTDRGLPISCYNTYASDTTEALLGDVHGELAMMSKNGGGTSLYMGHVRGRGAPIKGGRNGTSFGTVHFATHYQSLLQTASQGGVRRGKCAVFWDIEHPDIDEALGIRGDGHPIQHLHFGVCVGDAWLEAMVAGDPDKRAVWAKVLNARRKHGEPYLVFRDTVNRARPQWYKDQNLVVRSSNLCNETTPTSDESESFVCCLSSLNVRHFDEWKGTDFPGLMVYFLDAVISEFVEKARRIPYMGRAVRYAERHRSLGIGQFGWHDLLQSKMLPFDSPEAFRLNAEVARLIQAKTVAASERMAKDYGEPEVTRGYGRRHALLQAIAPTKTSAFIHGQSSEANEPRQSNYVIEDKAKGKFTFRNPYLHAVLTGKGVDVEAEWRKVLLAGGSVQGLDCLDAHEKAVFRTFVEIPQMAIIKQAAQRQQFVDQGQSLNLLIHKDVPAKDLNALVLEAWRSGIKGLYYNHNENAAQVFARDILSCTACEA